MKAILTALALSAALAGCATSSPDVIGRGDTQRLSQIQDATVLSSRPVTVDGSQSGGGAAAGAVVGGVAGSSVGGSREGLIVGVLGAVLGGVIGNAAERVGTREQAVEILVQLRSGERRAVVQARGDEVFQPGTPVMLVTTSGKTRVVRAPATVPSPTHSLPPPVRG